MIGPRPPGTWTSSHPTGRSDYDGLSVGMRYVVIREFVDFDGTVHSFGETWIFLGHSFAPYDDGLSLFVSIDGRNEWHLPLQCRPETQGPIADRLGEYVSAADPRGGAPFAR